MAAAGCGPEIETQIVLVDRSGCLACHRPLVGAGVPEGIEEAHPRVADYDGDGALDEMPCQDCHGGDPQARNVQDAHHFTSLFAGDDVRALTCTELDQMNEFEPEFLQFINPGDFRVANKACGGDDCHDSEVSTVPFVPMATFAGELNVPRYRAGMQRTALAEWGIKDAVDLEFDVATAPPSAVPSLKAAKPAELAPGETEIGPFQDIYLTKSCPRCHLWSFGENRFDADYRSSGCTACHMLYADDGLSRSADPRIDKGEPPHPIQHKLTKAIPTSQCTHCHYRGGRIGPSFQGYRESAGTGFNPPGAVTIPLGIQQHGHDAGYYITDEDETNEIDETPPDLHFEAGMHCIDCHTLYDVHGDGRLYSDTTVAVEIECEDCHGTAQARTNFKTSAGRPLTNIYEEDGEIWLRKKVELDAPPLRVPQVKDIVDAAPAGSLIHQSMGTYDSGFNHSAELECYTCHSGWYPNCYGCHPTVDMRKLQQEQITGEVTLGRVSGKRGWVVTDSFVLMRNNEGRISPSMAAHRMFFTAINGAGEKVIDFKVRTGPNGEVGMGQRAFPPHTVRRNTAWAACRTCHLAEDGSNEARVNETVGFGTDRFIQTDGAGKDWILDRIVDPDTFESQVLVGHDVPEVSRPLNREEITAMKAIRVP